MSEYSREDGHICEYDGYVIPQYDPTIPPEERKKRSEEVEAKFEALLARANSGEFD